VPSKLVGIGTLVREVGMSAGWLRHLADTGQIPSERSAGGHRRFDVDAVRNALARHRGGPPLADVDPVVPTTPPEWSQTVALEGASEDIVWRSVVEDLRLDPSSPAVKTVAYAFNEMLNNAIDHSGGRDAVVEVWALPERLAFRITDDGQGVFPHLRSGLKLADEFEAIQELTKGKRTTWPERHTGEGICFTSKVGDTFRLSAALIRWTVDNIRGDHAVGESPVSIGTEVYFEVSTSTTRTPAQVFAEFTEDFEFVRTRPVVKLFGLGMTFVSRSEARRLLDGLEAFQEVELDFSGVEDVGQGFVDELVRVWPAAHPGHTVVPTNMNSAVEMMVKRGLGPLRRSQQ
jgi:anti-sigma regulatory factor (Ser/Thr protein kinase)